MIIHYHHSVEQAQCLCKELNHQREGSAIHLCASLTDHVQIKGLAQQASKQWGYVDVLINNASSYYPTPFADVNEAMWDDLLSTNTKAPFFLSQALAETLQNRQGV